jgi:hypothetical protein
MPMLLTLNVHYTRISDMVVPDHLVTSPAIAIRALACRSRTRCGGRHDHYDIRPNTLSSFTVVTEEITAEG